MPPSTVFSYWRRDHRRTSPAPGSESPLGLSPSAFADAPPQLPGLPPSTTLGDTIVESTTSSTTTTGPPEPLPLVPSFFEKTGDISDEKSLAFGLTPQHSLSNLRAPSPSLENLVRLHSCPEDVNFAQESPSQEHAVNLDQIQTNHPSKANGSWRLGFKQNAATTNPQTDDSKTTSRSEATGKSLLINTNVNGTSGFVGGASLKDYKSTQSRQDSEQSAEPTQQKLGRRTKLHRLNPISLLAHRRSSQIAHSRQEDSNFSGQNGVPAIPDDYDPRIRGSIVHDFSAPRPRRNAPGATNVQDTIKEEDQSKDKSEQHKRHSEYSPVFKEHFSEDRKVLQVENKGYLQSSLLTEAHLNERDSSDLPAFARKLPFSIPENNDQSIEPSAEVSEQVPSKRASNSRKSAESSRQVPMRLKSDASRFSFDMGGVESSTQEKLLEEKHKEKEAARKESGRQSRSSYSDFDEDDFDYDALEDDSFFEERIPGVNTDADYDDQFSGFAGVVKTPNPLFVPVLPPIAASPISPMNPYKNTLNTTAGAVPEIVINPVDASASPHLESSRSLSDYGDEEGETEKDATFEHVAPAEPEPRPRPVPQAETKEPQQYDEDEDDIYFNDGDIDIDDFPTVDANEGAFDESIFDDENGELYERKFYPGTVIPITAQNEPDAEPPRQSMDSTASKATHLRQVPSLASEFRPESWDIQNEAAATFPGGDGPKKPPGGVLSEHNLEAFHSALARVADEAAADHLLHRNISLSETSVGQESISQNADSHPGLISDDSRLSHTMGAEDAVDDFNYDDDDAFDDDLIIAEANADALENDDEGFYGEEFGFYARDDENCDSQLTYGGYFGPGAGGINRSHSGGANFHGPSLTPITERSEWSTRNSIVSLTTHGQPNPLPNPGLAQLVDFGNLDDDISFEALMRLRRGAFGGSNGSLRSSAGSLSPQGGPYGHSNRASFMSIPEDSPVDLNSGTEFPSHLADYSAGAETDSFPSSEEHSSPGSPTMVSGLSADPEHDASGEDALGTTPKPSHSRASSSASISYKQETVEDGSPKWVLERRRTGDSGEMEVYQREVLEGSRI
ncbi:uncharacterized protein TRUGW13939_02866 [Talaromyces rugulosus]|uniref:AGC-kinase C-terminal domain-containing protein n=1 Tax=Talaromyces rugulosus TaxID=121627 RepID=A0A7H8QPG6_TALRU|nr:uncharacterized protein TRUGW13939_02866 [Talaromyces rugulosus]QKX55768.1 hypothetical protein TRUGW13939_02866 [Talaromyces rugulosus]